MVGGGHCMRWSADSSSPTGRDEGNGPGSRPEPAGCVVCVPFVVFLPSSDRQAPHESRPRQARSASCVSRPGDQRPVWPGPGGSRPRSCIALLRPYLLGGDVEDPTGTAELVAEPDPSLDDAAFLVTRLRARVTAACPVGDFCAHGVCLSVCLPVLLLPCLVDVARGASRSSVLPLLISARGRYGGMG